MVLPPPVPSWRALIQEERTARRICPPELGMPEQGRLNGALGGIDTPALWTGKVSMLE